LGSNEGFRKGLHWGYGAREVAEKRPKRLRRRGGFQVDYAELRGSTILVRATNTWDKVARVDEVVLTEISPEPKTDDKKAIPCQWGTSGFNLANPSEVVEIELKPSKPLKEGYAYEIAVWRQLSDEEQEAQWNKYGPFVAYNKGIPRAYIYMNGKLVEPQARKEPLPERVSSVARALGAETSVEHHASIALGFSRIALVILRRLLLGW